MHTESASPETGRPGPGYPPSIRAGSISYQSPKDHIASPYSPVAHTPPQAFSGGSGTNGVDGFGRQDAPYGGPTVRRGSFHSNAAPQRPPIPTNVNSYGVLSPAPTQHGFHGQHNATPQSVSFVPQQNLAPFNLPPSNFSETTTREREQQYTPGASGEYSGNGHQSAGDLMMLESMSMNQTQPVFGYEGVLNNSPHFLPDDFVQFLFADAATNSPSIGPVMGQGVPRK